jgi:hypothetical protein
MTSLNDLAMDLANENLGFEVIAVWRPAFGCAIPLQINNRPRWVKAGQTKHQAMSTAIHWTAGSWACQSRPVLPGWLGCPPVKPGKTKISPSQKACGHPGQTNPNGRLLPGANRRGMAVDPNSKSHLAMPMAKSAPRLPVPSPVKPGKSIIRHTA